MSEGVDWSQAESMTVVRLKLAETAGWTPFLPLAFSHPFLKTGRVLAPHPAQAPGHLSMLSKVT